MFLPFAIKSKCTNCKMQAHFLNMLWRSERLTQRSSAPAPKKACGNVAVWYNNDRSVSGQTKIFLDLIPENNITNPLLNINLASCVSPGQLLIQFTVCNLFFFCILYGCVMYVIACVSAGRTTVRLPHFGKLSKDSCYIKTETRLLKDFCAGETKVVFPHPLIGILSCPHLIKELARMRREIRALLP